MYYSKKAGKARQIKQQQHKLYESFPAKLCVHFLMAYLKEFFSVVFAVVVVF